MAIDIKKNQLSDEEYIRILGFVYDLWNEGEGRQHILNCLNNWFGCVCSSFWMVENNQQMVKPVGAKISESLLEDYEKEFYLQDSIYNVQKNSAFFSDKVVEENENPFMEGEALTPYKERLQAEGIWHRFSIFLRENGKIIGTIALFDSILSPPRSSLISLKCLETVAPFIEQEFIKHLRATKVKQELDSLRTVVKYSEIGLIAFERNLDNKVVNVVYHNTMCVKYCREFVNERLPERIVLAFLEKMVAPLGSIGKAFNDLAISMTSPRDNNYKIRIVEEAGENRKGKKTYTLFITPVLKIPDTPNDLLAEKTCADLIPQLTSKEKEIIMLIFQGKTNQEIADLLFISVSTVKTHIQHIFAKGEVKSRTALMAIFNSNNKE